jgi:hypothetical protein
MVLLARAAGAGGRDRTVAVATPAAAVATPPPIASPSPVAPVSAESYDTNVVPGMRLWDSHLVRIGLAAAAAVLLLVVLPIVILRSGGSKPLAAGRDAHAALLTTGALPGTLTPLAPELPATRIDVNVAPAKPVAPAPRAAASSPLPVPGPSEPLAGRSDLKAMQQALDRWKQAYESRDVAAVSRVWPTISTAQARSLDTAFDKMSQLTLLFRQCSLGGSVVRGAATCRVERSITFKTGKTETFPSRVAFQLEKRSERWVIVGVRGA